MNEMPTSLSSALGRINKYDGGTRAKERARGKEKKRGKTGGAIFIRDTAARARAHRYRRDYGPDLSARL